MSTDLATIIPQLQRRIARLLLRHDRRTFRGRFRELHARSAQPQPPLLRAYDDFTRLLGLADELFTDILPRIRRQLSFSATRLELDEEQPLRGQIDWRRTSARAAAEHPGQPPLRFATTLRSRSFATPENRMVAAVLQRYAQRLGRLRSAELFADAPLNAAEGREISQLVERVRRELATPQLVELAREADPSQATELVAAVEQRVRGASPYADLVRWWQRSEQQHLRASPAQQVSPVLQTEEEAGLLYQLWIALEIVNLLAERDLLSNPQISTDQLRFGFRWAGRDFVLVYDRSPTPHLAWTGAPGVRPDYFITRAAPQEVRVGDQIYWREPGVLLDAKCYLGAEASRASGAIKRLIADLQLVDARHGALLFPDTTGLAAAVRPSDARYLGTVDAASAIKLFALSPAAGEAALQEHLAAVLDQVAAWLPVPAPIACHGCFADPDTVNPDRRPPQAAPLIFCPKPHISDRRVDIVSTAEDCLKEPRVCHILGREPDASRLAPFVKRVLTQSDLLATTMQLRAHLANTVAADDHSEAAEQARGAVFEAIGALVEAYQKVRQPDTTFIEEKLSVTFKSHWSDQTHARGLPADVRNMLISGEFVHHEFAQSGVLDWAASAVQYVRAVERELQRRLYYRLGQPSPLRDRHGNPLRPQDFTFGSVTFAYYNRGKSDHNWLTFLSGAVQRAGAQPSAFEAVIKEIIKLHELRNNIAHSKQISQATAQQVRDITIGAATTGWASALRSLVELLDA